MAHGHPDYREEVQSRDVVSNIIATSNITETKTASYATTGGYLDMFDKDATTYFQQTSGLTTGWWYALTFDLQAITNFQRLYVYWALNATAPATSTTYIEYSDDNTNWTELKSYLSTAYGTYNESFGSQTFRYLRFRMVYTGGGASDGNYMRFYEINGVTL